MAYYYFYLFFQKMVRYRDILTSSSMLYYIGRYIVPINETNWAVFSALYYDMVYTFLDDDDGPTKFVLYIICLHSIIIKISSYILMSIIYIIESEILLVVLYLLLVNNQLMNIKYRALNIYAQ